MYIGSSLSFIASPIVTKYELGSWGLLLVCIVVATILCLINAGLYLLIRVPMLVISIGLLMVYETLNRVINNGKGAKLAGNVYTIFGRAPWIYVLALVVFLIFLVIFTYTKFGYNVRSLGNNQAIANNIGVNEPKNIVLSYILCGVILGVGAFLFFFIALTTNQGRFLDWSARRAAMKMAKQQKA